jgi:hypothetical protein
MFSESKASGRKAGWLVTFGLAGLALAGQAGAACMSLPMQGSPSDKAPDGSMVPAVFHPPATGAFYQVGDFQGGDLRSIVGLWEFKMSGFAVDFGTQAWHADGTELMWSGGQNPETGDVCQGVWRQTGPSSYTLNHVAMGWTAPGQGFGLRVHIHAKVNLDRSGQRFSGTYTAQVFVVSPADPFDETTQVGAGSGTVTATRVLPD